MLNPPSSHPGRHTARVVRRRSVFYFSGFDPQGASHYHALYRDEALKQSQTSGLQMEVGPRQKTLLGNAFWNVVAQTPEGAVHTRYEFLQWDDIVRRHWPKNQARLLWDVVATTWLNLRSGALLGMFKLAWPPAVALFSPFLLLGAVVLGGPLLAAGVFLAAAPALGHWAALAAAAASAAGWVQLGRMLEKKYRMLWLMRSYAFTARQAQGRVPELESRLARHADTVLKSLEAAQTDEVLLVGHSSGSTLAASVLARVLRRARPCAKSGGTKRPVVSLLTLGQCMPMLACLPQASGFRDDLHLLASAPGFDWLDFTAPPDGCCFALVDPLTACGPHEAARLPDRPKLLSPKFADMFDAPDYRLLRQDKFRIHFQYLMASGKPVAYDYFAVTSGAMTLAGRFSSFPSVQGDARFQIFPR